MYATLTVIATDLSVRFLMAVRTLYRRGFSSGVLGLVAGDAQACGPRGIVEGGRQSGFHGWGRRLSVAIGASLLRRLERLFGLGGVVTDFAFARDPRVGGMGKRHDTHGVPLELQRR